MSNNTASTATNTWMSNNTASTATNTWMSNNTAIQQHRQHQRTNNEKIQQQTHGCPTTPDKHMDVQQHPGDYAHYAEPVWASDSLNDMNRHIVLAMLDCHVKGLQTPCDLLMQTTGAAEQNSMQPSAGRWPGYRKGLPTALSWTTGPARQSSPANELSTATSSAQH